MKKAVLYARVSSDLQKKEGTIESQLEELKRQIRSSGNVLIKEYIDDGYSGASLDRPAMNELRKDLKQGVFDIIYVLNNDRIARDAMYLNIIISEILINKKQIIINGKDYINSPENKFELTILGAVAELERAKIMERSYRGKMHRLNQGQLVGHGCHVYGYRYFPKTYTSLPYLEIHEPEAKIVRTIFETYAKGNISTSTVARQVNLTVWRVRYMLSNETYAGTKYYNTILHRKNSLDNQGLKKIYMHRDRSEWIGIRVPAIISKELFNKVQEKLTYNRECYRNAKGTQLLSNLVFCNKCKKRCSGFRKFYSVKRSAGTTFYKRFYYTCTTNGPTHNPQIDMRLLESCVKETITNTLFDPEVLKSHLDIFKKKSIGTKKIENLLNKLTQTSQSIIDQKNRIIDLYSKGGIEQGEYYKRVLNFDEKIHKIQIERKHLLRQLPLFNKPEIIEKCLREYCYEIKKIFKSCRNFTDWRQFLLDNIKKINYDKSQRMYVHISLSGTIPIKVSISNIEEETEISFTVKRILTAEEATIRIRELDLQDGTIWGKPISRESYKKLTKEHI